MIAAEAAAAGGCARPGLATLGPSRLDTASSSSRAYLARIQTEQAAAARAIRTAVPAAKFGYRFQVVLNGLTVQLPVQSLPRLHALGGVARVYPSVRHYLKTNRSPSVIGATAFTAATGATGAGVKVAVVDDGIDQTNPSFNASGFSYPAGFPKGQTGFTTPKVIVARSFLAAGATAREQAPGRSPSLVPWDTRRGNRGGPRGRRIAGRPRPPADDGAERRGAERVDRQLPRLQRPDPGRNISTTGQTVAAFEQAVKDGMDVINYSGGSPAIDPRTDAMIETVANVTRAGVVVVASAGNDRDDFGFGSTGSPSTAPEAIGVAATSNTSSRRPWQSTSPPRLRPCGGSPSSRTRSAPSAWGQSDRSLVDVASITGTNGQPVPTQLCGIGRDPNAGTNPLPRGSLAGSFALITRGHCTFLSKAARAAAAARPGSSSSTTASARRTRSRWCCLCAPG